MRKTLCTLFLFYNKVKKLIVFNNSVWSFLWAKGYRNHITNPCSRIRGFHLHCTYERHYAIGSFISAGRHGRIQPGIKDGTEKEWFLIH